MITTRVLVLKICLIILTLTTAPSISAQQEKAPNFAENSDLDAIYKALKANDIEKAWSLAQKESSDWLGEPPFDFLYGLAAYGSREFHHAVFAFERVVAHKPRWIEARVHLARAYAAIKNYSATIDQIAILKRDALIPEKWQGTIDKLESIATKAVSNQALRIAQSAKLVVGYDSNVNAGTTEKTIFIPRLGAEVELFEDSLETADQFATASYSLNLAKPINQTSNWNLNVFSQFNQYQELTQYSHLNLNLLGSYDYQLDLAGKALKTELGVQVSPLWLGGSFYRMETSVFAGIKRAITKSYRVSVDVNYGQTDNDINDLLDTENVGFAINNQLFLAESLHSIKFSTRKETGSDAAINRQIFSLNYHLQYPVDEQWLLLGSVGLQHTKYDEKHPIFEDVREEDLKLAQFVTRYSLNEKFIIELAVKVQDKNSNIDLFTYERSVVSLGGQYIF